ncbi:hypothetical protein, partial [Sedimenticola hydrogenitrophicus]|uniref:hypothetical protein n=1 Tax=Sedimenticola hydrogenitrophicus TaxID=2967975 RepID=UPI0021A51D06
HFVAMCDGVQTMATSGDYASSVIKRPCVKNYGIFKRSQVSTNSLGLLDTALFFQKTGKSVFTVSRQFRAGVTNILIMEIWRVQS